MFLKNVFSAVSSPFETLMFLAQENEDLTGACIVKIEETDDVYTEARHHKALLVLASPNGKYAVRAVKGYNVGFHGSNGSNPFSLNKRLSDIVNGYADYTLTRSDANRVARKLENTPVERVPGWVPTELGSFAA